MSLKAFPTLPYSALDQFIAGLGCPELQIFVQFQHPKTLEAAINLAIEYTAFMGNLVKVMKPSLDNEGEICLFDLVLYVPSTIFQLYRDGSSWVEPVLS